MAWYDNDILNAVANSNPVTGSTLGAYMGGRQGIDAQKRATDAALRAQEAGYADVSAMQDPYRSVGIGALGQIEGMQDLQAPGEFDASGYDVNAYLDPSMQFQRKQMERSVAASAAARGGLLSGAAAKELQDRGAQLAQTDYGNAYNRMSNDRNFAYQNFSNKFQMARQANSDRLQRLQGLMQSGQNATNVLSNARMGLADDTGNALLMRGQLSAQQSGLASGIQSNLMNQGLQLGAAYLSGGGSLFGGGTALGGAGTIPQAELSPTIAGMQGYQGYTAPQTFGTGGNWQGQSFQAPQGNVPYQLPYNYGNGGIG
jgi:hypothetical protein